VDGRVDPITDKEIIDTELQLKDLESIDKRIARVEKTAKIGDKEAKKEYDVLKKYKEHLEMGKNARTLEIDKDALEVIKGLQLLTGKPVIYAANVEEESASSGNQFSKQLVDSTQDEDSLVIIVSASIEAQIAELENLEEKQLFLEEYGLTDSGLSRLIKASYQILNLITYFTAGEQEVRAWTIEKGWKAPRAAGVIHTDFEKGFIKAEVIKLEDYQKYGSEQGCREAGKLAIEGKEYVVLDGDVMHFRFNV
jgi:hypothetical protein